MSIFNDILQKINDIPNGYTDNLKNDLKSAFEVLEKFETEYIENKKAREGLKSKLQITLQSIDEDGVPASPPKQQTRKSQESTDTKNTNQKTKRASRKRSKDETDDMSSPDQDKRPKRSASVRAVNVIAQQMSKKPWWQILEDNDLCMVKANNLVNVNLTKKMRREEDPKEGVRESRRKGKEQDSDKENEIPVVKIKEEKLSNAPEPMENDNLHLEIKQERTDDVAMPPPSLPVPKPRGRAAKEKIMEPADESIRTRNSRAKKQTDIQAQPVSTRSTRASARNTTQDETQNEESKSEGKREKRTRKRPAKFADSDNEKSQEASEPPQEERPKRTRRGKNQKEQPQPDPEPEKQSTEPEKKTDPPTKKNKNNQQTEQSPKTKNKQAEQISPTKNEHPGQISPPTNNGRVKQEKISMESSPILQKELELTRVLSKDGDCMDTTVSVAQPKFNHQTSTPNKDVHINETIIIQMNRETMILDKPNHVMDATVVIEKGTVEPNITDDNSIMTDDNSQEETNTPPRETHPQPTSAVKEKVQQFEEMATRVTRTKTRAMAKKDESTENQTPPDKVSKMHLTSDTLSKMDSLIFNGKMQQTSSAAKPRSNVPVKTTSSTSKLSSYQKHKEMAEEALKKEKDKEDARKKKEALLEAKRDNQKKRREEKMQAAALARQQASENRRLALEALARDKCMKQVQADNTRMDRVREAERRRLEALKRAEEIEERRIAEERARVKRLEEEQKRAELVRKRQIMEQENSKKEALIMAKEIEKRKKEYMEKQKLKQKMEAEKLLTPVRSQHTTVMEPVHMQDGFEHLNSDEESDVPPKVPPPIWSSSKYRYQKLVIQNEIKQHHIDRLFKVRTHSPDLSEIFPQIDRRYLKRTSSAVWRTPPQIQHLAVLHE